MSDHRLVLWLVRCCGEVSVGELSLRSGLAWRRLGDALRDLTRAGLVKRGDSRECILYDVTAAGRASCPASWTVARDLAIEYGDEPPALLPGPLPTPQVLTRTERESIVRAVRRYIWE